MHGIILYLLRFFSRIILPPPNKKTSLFTAILLLIKIENLIMNDYTSSRSKEDSWIFEFIQEI